jgi:gamma-glutamyltranspeptidase/glutathione hydrolase
MNILERFPVGANKWGSVANLHLLAETLKIVSADRGLVGGAPHWKSPASGLASKAYATQRSALIGADRSLGAKDVPEGNAYPFKSKDTTHFSIADAKGRNVRPLNTMGSIQSIMVDGAHFLGAADTRRPDAAAIPVD